MATNRTWAQAVISCDVDLCEKPAQQFCNSCQVKLCVECVPKHVDKKSSMSHDIVHFRNRRAQLVFTECELHEGQRCLIQCQQCQTPICYKCNLGPHKHHNAVDMTDLVGIKKEEIQREAHEIENEIIPRCKKTYGYLKDDLSRITAEINKVEEEKEKLRSIWHQEVDYLFDELGSLFAETKKQNSEILQKNKMKIKTRIKNMSQTLQRNKDILKTKNASDIADYDSKVDIFRRIDTRADFKKPILKANTLKGEQLCIAVGKIQATLTFSQLSSPSTDASERTNQTQLNRAPRRPVPQRTPKNRLHDDERMSRLRLDDAPRPYSPYRPYILYRPREFQLQRQTQNDDFFSGSD